MFKSTETFAHYCLKYLISTVFTIKTRIMKNNKPTVDCGNKETIRSCAFVTLANNPNRAHLASLSSPVTDGSVPRILMRYVESNFD